MTKVKIRLTSIDKILLTIRDLELEETWGYKSRDQLCQILRMLTLEIKRMQIR